VPVVHVGFVDAAPAERLAVHGLEAIEVDLKMPVHLPVRFGEVRSDNADHAHLREKRRRGARVACGAAENLLAALLRRLDRVDADRTDHNS